MGKFQIGDRVVADVAAQGMRVGELFDVIDIEARSLLGMTFTTLTLRSLDDGRELRIVNGHVLLSRAPGTDAVGTS
jgi:hypothetical protein